MSATIAKKKPRKVLKTVPGVCRVYDDGSIRIDKVRVSYPHVGKAQKNTNDAGEETGESYGLSALLPKDTHMEAMKACRDAIRSLEVQMTQKGKGKAGKPYKYPSARKFIKDADAVDPSTDESMFFSKNPEYAGHFVISCRSNDQPQMRGAKKDPETGKPERLTSAQATKLIYGGSYCTILIRPWPQDHKTFGLRANAELLAVQYRAKGEPFGSARRLDDDDIDDSLDADDDDDLADDGGFEDDDL